jgi:hypothetical protein
VAVSRCPSCGDLFFEDVATCPSCGADLVEVEDRRTVPADVRPAASVAHERRELHEWTMEGRRLLDGMLHRAGIPRSWQGSTLLTPEVEHQRVEEMVALVGTGDARVGEPDERAGDDPADDDRAEDDVADDDVADATEPALVPQGLDEDGDDEDGEGDGPDGDVGYDLTGWTDLARGDLVAALAEAEIEHGWDADGDLVVGAADEARVDAIFERLTDADSGDAANDDLPDDNFYDDVDDDGLLVQETLSDLFVGADRLLHNPLDGSAARLVIDGRDQARALRLPFGFERPQWRTILAASDALADSFEPGGIDDDAIRERAATLRALLRDLV